MLARVNDEFSGFVCCDCGWWGIGEPRAQFECCIGFLRRREIYDDVPGE